MLDKVVEYFKNNDAICKRVDDPRPEYGDFIAVFGFGNLTREEIMKPIKDNNLAIMFFESSIYKNRKTDIKQIRVGVIKC